jgi:hypothetical protein
LRAAFVLRVDYTTELPEPYFKAVNFATGLPLHQGPFGDVEIHVPAGLYQIGIWIESEDDRFYSCHVGTLNAEVPASVSPSNPAPGSTVSESHFASSGREVTFFSGDLNVASEVSAMVQWSLGSCTPPYDCPTHGIRRLRIRLNGEIVGEVSVDGLEDWVTQLTVSAVTGPGHVTVTGVHTTTRSGVGVAVWAGLASIEIR